MLKLRQAVASGLIACTLSSCATVFGGHITDYQRTRPLPGQPQREVRVAALVLDIFLVGALGVAVDFATGAIYKPHPRMPTGGPVPPPPPPVPAAVPAPAVAPAPAAPAPTVK